MWYCIPGFLAAIYQEDTPFLPFYSLKQNASPTQWFTDFTITFSLESSAVCVVLILLLIFRKKRSNSSDYAQIAMANLQKMDRIGLKQKWLSLSLFAPTLIYQARTATGDYLIDNSAELYGSADPLSQLIVFIKSLTYVMVILIALFESRKKLVVSSFCLIALESVLAAIGGARINILATLIIYLFRKLMLEVNSRSYPLTEFLDHQQAKPKPREKSHSKARKRRKVIIGSLASFLFVWYIFLPVAQSMAKVRASGEINWAYVLEDAFFNDDKSDLSPKDALNDSVVSTLFGKLDIFTGGSMLTSESGYGTAGLTPYIGAMLVVLPRPIYPSKPAAGTSDGTIFTHPSRLVPRSVGVDSDSLNIGVSPLHISLWHFGILGFPVFVLALLANFKFLDWLLTSKSFLNNALGLYTISIPTFAVVFPAPDVVLKNIILVCLFLAFLAMLRLLNPAKKSKFYRA
jgi:hypothetical protein